MLTFHHSTFQIIPDSYAQRTAAAGRVPSVNPFIIHLYDGKARKQVRLNGLLMLLIFVHCTSAALNNDNGTDLA